MTEIGTVILKELKRLKNLNEQRWKIFLNYLYSNNWYLNMNLEIEIVEHLNKASEFLKAANLCLNAKLWNASVSRSYYSIYHTAIAAILYRHHGGVRHPKWSHEFTSAQFSKIVSQSSQFGRKMEDAKLERHKADYGTSQVPRRLSRIIFNDAEEIYDWAICFIDIGEFQELLEVYEDDFNVRRT